MSTKYIIAESNPSQGIYGLDVCIQNPSQQLGIYISNYGEYGHIGRALSEEQESDLLWILQKRANQTPVQIQNKEEAKFRNQLSAFKNLVKLIEVRKEMPELISLENAIEEQLQVCKTILESYNRPS